MIMQVRLHTRKSPVTDQSPPHQNMRSESSKTAVLKGTRAPGAIKPRRVRLEHDTSSPIESKDAMGPALIDFTL